MESGGSAKISRPLLAVTNWLGSWILFRTGAGSVGDVPLNSHASVGARSGALLLLLLKHPPSRDTSCREHSQDNLRRRF